MLCRERSVLRGKGAGTTDPVLVKADDLFAAKDFCLSEQPCFQGSKSLWVQSGWAGFLQDEFNDSNDANDGDWTGGWSVALWFERLFTVYRFPEIPPKEKNNKILFRKPRIFPNVVFPVLLLLSVVEQVN